MDPGSGLMIFAFHSTVIKMPRATILVDTCSGNEKERPNKLRYRRKKWPYLANLVLLIQRIHKRIGICDTGPWLWGWTMAQQVCVVLSTVEREQLAAIVADRNRPRKHVERAHMVLASADRHSVQQVAHSIGVSRPTVWRWQQRFAESGVEGLLRDKTRKPGKAPIVAETTARVVALTCTEPPHEATHWTGRAMAKAIGISVGSVQRIWRAHKLQPHRLRTFKRSRDPSFATKLADIVGLYVDPPAHAVVLSIDEKSQIQALDRTQPGLPIKPGRCQTMTHDYKRHSLPSRKRGASPPCSPRSACSTAP